MTDTASPYRPRRSCLYMPGSNSRALERARTIAADVLILDLEDAVPPDSKEVARDQVTAAVAADDFGGREVVVRINGLDTPWGKEDLTAAITASPDAILVPKVVAAADIYTIDAALDAAGASLDCALWVMIEMPLAILNIGAIGAAAADTRLTAFVMGTNDLAKEMRAETTPDRAAFTTALALTLTAARAHGLIAIDGVYNDIGNAEGLANECHQGRTIGFDGKTLIHPSQLATCNTVFSPSDDVVEQAQAVIAAFTDPANAGIGVLKVNGKMTELLHLDEACRLIAIANAIARS